MVEKSHTSNNQKAMARPGNKKRDMKRNHIFQLLVGLVIIVLVNVIGYYIFTRFDLTAEKRYTLSDQTKKMLRDLDDVVFLQVYLEGDFPAGFKRLRRETKEMLDQFRAYSDNLQYEFINPSASDDQVERNAVYQRLMERGLNPTDLQVKTNEGSSQQIIFPGAIASYRGKELPVELLVSQLGLPPEEVLNNSIQNLEFNLANTIRRLTMNIKPRVAFIEGHSELGPLETADIARSLQEYYQVERVAINGQLNSLTEREENEDGSMVVRNKFNTLIIAKPDSAFSEKDKFILDQFIMRGGSVLWLIDPVFASMDSLENSSTIGIIHDINVNDQLFHYGVRLNTNLVMDLACLPIPVRTGEVGGAPQFDFFPWYYFPVITPMIDHPIVKNLNAIKTEFISSIDTVKAPGIKKTILLTSSKYARTVNTPVPITLDIIDQEPDRRLYNKQDIPLAVLLEGKFNSLYTNRVPPEIRESEEISFVEEGSPSRMIVVADGDVIKNQIRLSDDRPVPYPLGFDRYTNQTFGNKEFILNALNYLTEEDGLISIRSRELKLRLLDRPKVNKERVQWQVLNTVLPVMVILLLGVIMYFIRKRKYS
jgi:ABC-2 type transport system permease protein